MRALPGTPVGGLFPPRLPPAIGEGQPHMAEQFRRRLYVCVCVDVCVRQVWHPRKHSYCTRTSLARLEVE